MTDPGIANGTLFVVSAPSGAGKTSLVRALLEHDSQVELLVSHTTRARRAAERDGDHYHFIDTTKFERMRAGKEFIEHAQVFGNYYGTSRDAVVQRLQRGVDVVLEIDWQGARQIRQQISGSVGIFILPPSLEHLRTRLRSRAQDDAQIIEQRMQASVQEISHYQEYDYLVMNDDFATACEDLLAIVSAQRLRQSTQADRLYGLLSGLIPTRHGA
jgi:guanylate kinase